MAELFLARIGPDEVVALANASRLTALLLGALGALIGWNVSYGHEPDTVGSKATHAVIGGGIGAALGIIVFLFFGTDFDGQIMQELIKEIMRLR